VRRRYVDGDGPERPRSRADQAHGCPVAAEARWGVVQGGQIGARCGRQVPQAVRVPGRQRSAGAVVGADQACLGYCRQWAGALSNPQARVACVGASLPVGIEWVGIGRRWHLGPRRLAENGTGNGIQEHSCRLKVVEDP
jgi:hypothetical protein